MIVRSLNPEGLRLFEEFLVMLKETPTSPVPVELVDNPKVTEVIDGIADVEQRVFESKFQTGQYLVPVLASIPSPVLHKNSGLWSWLALFYFDQVCPADGHGRRKRLSLEKYLPSTTDHRRGFDKHLLFFPWKMYKLHANVARHILVGPLQRDSRAQREWTGYGYNVCTELVKIADKLYFDAAQGKLKHGATGKQKGSLRNFTRLLNQIDLTYDLWGMPSDKIIPLLPHRQFERFLPADEKF